MNGADQTATVDGLSVLPSMYLGSRFFEIPSMQNKSLKTYNGAGGNFYVRWRWL